MTEFDDDENKLKHLQEVYKILFDFWQNHVIPELQNYLLKNKEVIKLNRFTELLQSILENKIEVKPGKDISTIINSKLAIVSTNYPKLLFIDICKNLREKSGNLMDSKNFFTFVEKLNNPQIFDEFKQICLDNQELDIFIDCTKGVAETLGKVSIDNKFNYTFVVSSEKGSEELNTAFRKKGLKNVTKMDINYSWNDLTEESQNLMLQTKINFQNNSQISLIDLLKNEKDLSKIIDDQFLNFLVEKHGILVNTILDNEINEKYFNFVYKSRQFVNKQERNREARSQEDLLSEVKNKKYVLISDQAGNGKSWSMKNFTRILSEQNSTSWVTYVDLKQFIDKFKAQMKQEKKPKQEIKAQKAQKSEPKFSTFMIEHILKPQQQFEVEIFQKLYNEGRVFIFFDGFEVMLKNFFKYKICFNLLNLLFR